MKPLRFACEPRSPPEAVVALQTDAQMSSRFTPMELPRWSESEVFRKFLHAFERLLPLKNPSSLSQRGLVQSVLAAAGRLTARVRPEPTMKLPHSVCEVLRDHVVLESKCIRTSAVSSV